MRDTRSTDLKGSATAVAPMDSFYSLWDVDSGNSLGTYATREEALAVARALIGEIGPAYADDLDLSFEESGGDIRHVATGAALLSMIKVDHRVSAD